MIDVSVIIPVYNVGNYIESAIESVLPLKNTVESELIIVDDGSDDGTGDIVSRYQKMYPDFIHYYELHHQGVSYARNYGIDSAKGRYILFCDGDDEIVSESVKKMIDVAESKKLDLVFSKIQEFDDLKSHVYAATERLSKCDFIEKSNTDILWSFMISGKLYRKSVLDRQHIRFENLSYSEDAVFQMQMVCCAERMGGCPEIISKYRKRLFYENDSVTQQYTLMHWQDFYKAHCRVEEIIKNQLFLQIDINRRAAFMETFKRKTVESMISAFYRSMWNCDAGLLDEIVEILQQKLMELKAESRVDVLKKSKDLSLWPVTEKMAYYAEHPGLSVIVSEKLKAAQVIWLLKSLYAQKYIAFNVLVPVKLKAEIEKLFIQKNIFYVEKTSEKLSLLDEKILKRAGKYFWYVDRGMGVYTTTIKKMISEMEKQSLSSASCRCVLPGQQYTVTIKIKERLKNRYLYKYCGCLKFMNTNDFLHMKAAGSKKRIEEYMIQMNGSEKIGNF